MTRFAWGLVIVLALGVLGPRLTPNGVSSFSGEQRIHAQEALFMADLHMDNPVENLLLQRLRVTRVVPTQTPDDPECRWAVTVRAYTMFWLHRTLVVKCRSVSG